LISSILHKESESLIKIRPALAPELDHVVFQALSKKRADRYQTMEEFREDLAAIAEGLKPLKAKARPAAVKLAVLPFSNLTGDPDQEYLSDGLTQEMVTLLGRLHPQSLGVIARTSVMRYKKTDTPIDQIGPHDYLRGSFHLWKLTPGDLDIAEKYIDLALEKDPAYAPVTPVAPGSGGVAASSASCRPRRRGHRPSPRPISRAFTLWRGRRTKPSSGWRKPSRAATRSCPISAAIPVTTTFGPALASRGCCAG